MFKTAHELVIAARKSISECSAAQVQEKLHQPDTLVIDVREPDEYRQGHLSSAINIPRGLLEFKLSGEPALQRLDRPIVVYCKSSGRAALAVVAMQEMGFCNVVSLAGGFDAWAAAGLPQVKPRAVAFE
ncbi:MAG: rhodanese-like domain-containing protein [Bacteroidota bacterium]